MILSIVINKYLLMNICDLFSLLTLMRVAAFSVFAYVGSLFHQLCILEGSEMTPQKWKRRVQSSEADRWETVATRCRTFCKLKTIMEIPVFTVDAFTNVPFKGNPAAVCPLKHVSAVELKVNPLENRYTATKWLIFWTFKAQIRSF